MSKQAKKPKKKKKTIVKVKREIVAKGNSYKRLSTGDIEKMFKLYVTNPIVRFVAKSCRVSETTVRKYRDRDNWDRRREDIIEKARRKDSNEAAKSLTENLKIVRFAKAKLIKKIQTNKAKSRSTYAELDRMVRLEGFLLGQPDSRPAVGRFEHLTDEQLNEKLLQLSAFREPNEQDESSDGHRRT